MRWTGASAVRTRPRAGTAPPSAPPCLRRPSGCGSIAATAGASATVCAWRERRAAHVRQQRGSLVLLASIVLVVRPVRPVAAAVPSVPLEVHVVEHGAEHGRAHVA